MSSASATAGSSPSTPAVLHPAPALACPHCRSAIEPQDVLCKACGANIALMTLVTELEILGLAASSKEAQSRVTTEQLVPRLGDYLVRRGYVTPEQLQAALVQQAAAPAGEQRRLLGQTLVQMGLLSPHALDHAIAQHIIELQAALLEANHTLEQRVVERTAELEAALTRLTEFNQLKANLIANISHELRTPLTHIKGYNVLMADGALGPLTGEQRESLRITTGAIERLEQLISDLISYAAAARGELTLNLRPVSVAGLIEQVVQKSLAKAEKRQVALVHQFPPDLPPVIADEEKLFWTLLQLIDNGVKFTPRGGRVTVSAANLEHHVLVSVRDTGIGIPPHRVEEIFEPFRQLDGSSTRRYGGTGLGLALVRRIVEAHGGQIRVESREGQGSVFSLGLAHATAR